MQPMSDIELDDWLSAGVMFSFTLNNNFSSDAISSFSGSNNTDKVVALFAELLLLHWASFHISSPHQRASVKRIPDLIRRLLCSTSGTAVMSSLLNRNCGNLPSRCSGRAVLQFRHLAVLRVLVHLPPKTFAQRYGIHISDLLSLYAEVAFSFDRQSPGTSETQEMISLDELLESSRYLKAIIAVTPVSILRSISQDAFLACGPDVVASVQRRFSGS